MWEGEAAHPLSATAQGTAGGRSGSPRAAGRRRGSGSGAGVPRGRRYRAAPAPLSPPGAGRTLTAESLGLAEERLRVRLQLRRLRALRGRLRVCCRRLLLRGAAPLLGRQQLLLARPLQPQPATQAAQHGAAALGPLNGHSQRLGGEQPCTRKPGLPAPSAYAASAWNRAGGGTGERGGESAAAGGAGQEAPRRVGRPHGGWLPAAAGLLPEGGKRRAGLAGAALPAATDEVSPPPRGLASARWRPRLAGTPPLRCRLEYPPLKPQRGGAGARLPKPPGVVSIASKQRVSLSCWEIAVLAFSFWFLQARFPAGDQCACADFPMKYILVTGGVISGIGKGIIASSIGTILKSCGLRVTAIKIDPYINIDAGTFSPYEHGEVFVLNDGGEVDLDLGNYERFLDINLYKDNNITTGKIYQHVINKERHGDYLGKTVQVVPHITDAVQEWVMNQAKVPVDDDRKEPQICVIELGGTIGDIEGMPFVEAFRQFQFKAKRENFCNIHVSLVPQPNATGEQKTKPTQNSVRALRGLGLSPDLIVCRSAKPIEMAVKEKISMFCHVEPEQVIFIHDVSSTYRVPILLEEQGIIKYFKQRLNLPIDDQPSDLLMKWKKMADRYERLLKVCSIALVGKYTKLSDCYASVFKALEHSALAINHKLDLMYIDSTELERSTEAENSVKYHQAWQKLCKADGILVPGGFGIRGTEGKLQAISWARTKKKPFLGVCLGMQLAVVEFARNCLNWKDANSTEFDPDAKNPVGNCIICELLMNWIPWMAKELLVLFHLLRLPLLLNLPGFCFLDDTFNCSLSTLLQLHLILF
ncbi:CTP synthase 2 isoform 2-T2 [Alca torda]